MLKELISVQLLRRKFTIAQYHKMVESGILKEDDRVELIRGEIVEMSPIGTKHAACVMRLIALLSKKLSDRAIVNVQNPIELNNFSEPQPDVTLLQPREDFYESSHPQASDIFLIIEVADTTVKYDREIKIPLYAEDNITEVWLIDLNQQCIEVYRNPTSNGYQNLQTFRQGQALSMQAFPDINLTANGILGI
jgi:Uma2 family endonuclease